MTFDLTKNTLQEFLSGVDGLLVLGADSRTAPKAEATAVVSRLRLSASQREAGTTVDSGLGISFYEFAQDATCGSDLQGKSTWGVPLPLSDLWMFRLKYFRAWLILLMDLGVSTRVVRPSLASFFKNVASWPLEDFVSFLKFQLAYGYAKCTRDVLPSNPGCDPIPFSGPLRTWLKRRLARAHNADVEFFFSVLHMKRAMHEVPVSFVHKTLLRHSEVLSRPPPEITEEDLEDYSRKFESLFRGMRFGPLFTKEPSQSAGFEVSRGFGGQREHIREDLKEELNESYDELIGMVEVSGGRVEEVRGLPAPNPEWLLSHAWERGRSALRRFSVRSLQKYPSVQAVPVLEPLKVRVITKGDPWTYWAVQFVQKAMHTHLKNLPQFVALGRPLNGLDIMRSIGTKDIAVSGDYSQATDTISIVLTKACTEVVLQILWESKDLSVENYLKVRDLVHWALYEQIVAYPEVRGGPQTDPGIPAVLQMTGQMMGSILSFPILCAINFCTLWRAKERFLNRRLKLEEVKCLVNGDILFTVRDSAEYEIWKMSRSNWSNSEFGEELSSP